MEGLVSKLKEFLPRDLLNPKGKSFDAERIGCRG